jgi:pseudaminic acid cytidylyltransferase
VSDTPGRRVAVVPARGGSKRVPRKNIRPLGGRPLIAWALETCLESNLFDEVVVSTDDQEIADLAASLGASVPFMRPAELADDHTPLAPVMAHAINELVCLGAGPEAVCCVYPGSPGLRAGDLAGAWEALEASAWASYALGVLEYSHPIQRALERDPDGLIRMLDPAVAMTRTQDLPPRWHDAGQFVWGRTSAWLEGTPIFGNAVGYELASWRTVDLDTEADWRRAEVIFRAIRELDPLD